MSKTDDELAKVRQFRYTAAAVITAAGPALAVALAEGGVAKWIAVAIAVGSVFTGAAGSAYAAKNTRSQRADGRFDPAPEPLSPADQIIAALPAVVGAQTQAAADIERVKAAATDVLGSAVRTVFNVGTYGTNAVADISLAQEVARAAAKLSAR